MSGSCDHPAPRGRLPAYLVALAAGLGPLIAVNVGLVISIGVGAIEPTLPYVDGETSISRANRDEPAVRIFRALVLPSAVPLAATWWIASRWLARQGFASRRLARWIFGLGLAAALCMVLYASFLGASWPVYRLLRRYGIYVFFGGTGLVELLITVALARRRHVSVERWVRRTMVACCALMLAAGPVNLAADHALEHDGVANVLEWWFGLAMIGFPLLLARIWYREQLEFQLR